MKEIKVTINEETGAVEIEAVGFKGDECLEATRIVEEAIGKVTDRKKQA